MTRTVRSSRVDAANRPLYARVLRLRHLAPSGLLCFVFLEGALVLGALLALAELVSWWGVLVLPFTVALMVKFNDLVAGAFTPRPVAGESASARASVLRSTTPAVRPSSTGDSALAGPGASRRGFAGAGSSGRGARPGSADAGAPGGGLHRGFAEASTAGDERAFQQGFTEVIPPVREDYSDGPGSSSADAVPVEFAEDPHPAFTFRPAAGSTSGAGSGWSSPAGSPRRGSTYSFSPTREPGRFGGPAGDSARFGGPAGDSGRFGGPAGDSARFGGPADDSARFGGAVREPGRFGPVVGPSPAVPDDTFGPSTVPAPDRADGFGVVDPFHARSEGAARPGGLAPVVSRDPAALGYGPAASPEFMTSAYQRESRTGTPVPGHPGTLAPGTFMAGASGYGHPYAGGGYPSEGQSRSGDPGEGRSSGFAGAGFSGAGFPGDADEEVRPPVNNAPTRRPWAEQLDVRQQMARQAAARRYQ